MKDYWMKNSDSNGKKSEQKFKEILNRLGVDCYESSKRENIYDHIDFFVKDSYMKSQYTVDVKNYADRDVWIELQGTAGFAGWLYGKADYLAVDFGDEFYMVKLADLRQFIRTKVNFILVDNKKDALYNLYRRRNMKDLLTKITKEDIIGLSEFVL